MTVKVELSLDFRSKSAAEAVYRSLKPDNVGLPESLKMKMRVGGRRLRITFHSEGKVETLVSTVDEVLEHVQVSTKVLGRASGKDAGHTAG